VTSLPRSVLLAPNFNFRRRGRRGGEKVNKKQKLYIISLRSLFSDLEGRLSSQTLLSLSFPSLPELFSGAQCQRWDGVNGWGK
jgi:hypothetical protein